MQEKVDQIFQFGQKWRSDCDKCIHFITLTTGQFAIKIDTVIVRIPRGWIIWLQSSPDISSSKIPITHRQTWHKVDGSWTFGFPRRWSPQRFPDFSSDSCHWWFLKWCETNGTYLWKTRASTALWMLSHMSRIYWFIDSFKSPVQFSNIQSHQSGSGKSCSYCVNLLLDCRNDSGLKLLPLTFSRFIKIRTFTGAYIASVSGFISFLFFKKKKSTIFQRTSEKHSRVGRSSIRGSF